MPTIPMKQKKFLIFYLTKKITIVCKEPVLFLTADTGLTYSSLNADVVLDHNK